MKRILLISTAFQRSVSGKGKPQNRFNGFSLKKKTLY